jgi:thiol:disulfide interchange protein
VIEWQRKAGVQISQERTRLESELADLLSEEAELLLEIEAQQEFFDTVETGTQNLPTRHRSPRKKRTPATIYHKRLEKSTF